MSGLTFGSRYGIHEEQVLKDHDLVVDLAPTLDQSHELVPLSLGARSHQSAEPDILEEDRVKMPLLGVQQPQAMELGDVVGVELLRERRMLPPAGPRVLKLVGEARRAVWRNVVFTRGRFQARPQRPARLRHSIHQDLAPAVATAKPWKGRGDKSGPGSPAGARIPSTLAPSRINRQSAVSLTAKDLRELGSLAPPISFLTDLRP